MTFDFAFSDIPRVFMLAFLELALSADNAVVLGVVISTLPHHLRRKALYIGLFSACFLRAGALALVSYLLQHTWFELLGGLYLLYLCCRYFIKKGKSIHMEKTTSFWKTVFLIEVLDLIFALDSILAGVAFIDATLSKLWIVYLGGIMGLVGIRYAADLFSNLLERYPKLESSAYLMVGWVGIKLALNAASLPLPPLVFWLVTLFLFFPLGFLKPKR
jgi:YkoY family integral membrane protein